MDSQAPPPSLPACQSVSLAEQLQAFVARLGSTEIQSLLASVKACGPEALSNVFISTLEDSIEQNLSDPFYENLDAAWMELGTQYQGLKRLRLNVEPTEVTLPPSPPESPTEKAIVHVDDLAVAYPIFNTVRRHLATKHAPRFNLYSEVPLNTRMLLILLHGGNLIDAGLFVCRVPHRMRDILDKFRVQCYTKELLHFVSSPSEFVDYVCIVETPAMDVAPNPTSEAKSERIPVAFVPVTNWSPPQQKDNLKRRATEDLDDWVHKRPKMVECLGDDIEMKA